MFFHSHGRGCGPRGGGWSRGPFGFGWDEAAFRERQGGGRARRMFDGSELRLVLLRMIADEPRHGYELIRAIEELTGGAYAPSPGVVYPALTMLAEMELTAEQRTDGARKRFEATEAGREHLAERAEEVAALIARLRSIGEQRTRSDGAPIRRAMGNLKVALQQRLATGEITGDTLHDVAALIDEVAQKIERLR